MSNSRSYSRPPSVFNVSEDVPVTPDAKAVKVVRQLGLSRCCFRRHTLSEVDWANLASAATTTSSSLVVVRRADDRMAVELTVVGTAASQLCIA